MSRTKSSLNGFSFDIIGQIVTQLVLLYLIPQYIVLSSAELYGLWLTINSLIGWMSIADIGIGMALGRKLIYATTQKNNNPDFDKDYATSISTALFSFAISAVVILLVGSLFIAYALTTFKINPTNYIEFKQTFFIALIAASLSLPLSVFPAIVETHLKLSFIRITGTITGLCGHAVGFTLLWLGYGIKSLAIGILCGILLNALANFIYSKKLSGYSIGVQYFSFSEFKSLFAFGGYFQLGRIANTVAVSTDNIVISMLINPASVASYSFTAKLSQLFGIIIASKIPISLLPGITQCFAEGNKTKLQEIHSSLNQNVQNINSSIQNSATPSTTVTELPAVNPTKPIDDGTNKS